MIGLNRRRVMGGGGNPLPYDAEIEYLESSGTQWIDTGILPTSDEWVLEIKIKTPNSTGNYVVCGAVEYDSNNIICRYVPLWAYNGYLRCTKCIGTYSDTYAASTYLSRNTTYTITSKINDRKVTLTVNDSTYSVNDTNNHSFVTKTLTLFARNDLNEVDAFFPGLIYYAKIYKNGVLFMDLIPVRVGQIGYMYDRVSGELFGNDGTGSFVLGNDK